MNQRQTEARQEALTVSRPVRLRRSHRSEELDVGVEGRIHVVQGDITKQQVDAVVNAANEALLGGGGVDGAIHRAAGPLLLIECRRLGGCEVGQAKLTRGYDLPARWVIHTVGPVWEGGGYGEDELLAECYRNSLALAVELGVGPIAFPSISTGAYGYPIERASAIAVRTIAEFLEANETIREVRLVAFGRPAYDCLTEALEAVADGPPQ